MPADMRTPSDGSYSFCGVDCTPCDIRKATLYGDKEALQRAHDHWKEVAREHWGMQKLDPAILQCKGCRTEGTEVFKGCRLCPIRRCVKSKGLSSCGSCSEWRDCDKLSRILARYSEARGNLEGDEAAFKE